MREEQQELWDNYKAWLLEQAKDKANLIAEDCKIELRTPYAVGIVEVHDLDTAVVELSVTNLADGENKFYLHFELKYLAHAQELFTEMLDTLLGLENRQKLRILLCCTSGMTTGFFRDKLSEAAELLSLDYEFSAVPFRELYQAGFDCQVILLAPQIAYHYKEACQVFQDRLVLKIPPKAFASYDAAAVLQLIKSERENQQHTTEEQAVAKALGEIESKESVLSVVVMPFKGHTRIAYRIYQKGVPVSNEMVIKGRLRVAEDLQDIMDTVGCRCRNFDAVGIAVPGVPRNGCLDLDETMIDPKLNLQALLEEKYGVPVVITNNVNAAALGHYAQQDRYQNILFISHPRGYTMCGQASIVNGQLVRGSHNIAGEIKYLLYTAMEPSEWREHQCTSDLDKIAKYISIAIRAGIAVLDPEVVIVRSEMLADMDRLKKQLVADYLPEEYLPEFVHVTDEKMAEYALLGQMILTLEAMEEVREPINRAAKCKGLSV